MAVRQQDIAQYLGISTYTVSMALRNVPKVAASTRQQVLEAAEKLGYNPRSHATTTVDIQQVAFVTIFELADLFYASVLNGAAAECQHYNTALRYFPFPNPSRQKQRAVAIPAEYAESDGILLVGQIDEATVQQFEALKNPLVLVDNAAVDLPIDRVLVENTMSTQRTFARLVRWGHRKIAFIRGPEDTTSFRERLASYRAAALAHNLEPIELYTNNASIAFAEEMIGGWLNEHGQPTFSAIIGCNDEVAIGTIYALQARGYQVPQDISVVGFDDIDMAKSMRPALTTSYVDRELLGRLAVRQLFERAKHPDARSRAVVLDTQFVERASAGPVKATVKR